MTGKAGSTESRSNAHAARARTGIGRGFLDHQDWINLMSRLNRLRYEILDVRELLGDGKLVLADRSLERMNETIFAIMGSVSDEVQVNAPSAPGEAASTTSDARCFEAKR
jgi:hypothetical protein